jgi:hypothetical protein
VVYRIWLCLVFGDDAKEPAAVRAGYEGAEV